MKIKPNLKTQLCISFIATIFIPLLIMAVLTYYVLTDSLKHEISNKNLLLARSIAGEIDVFLNAPIHLLRQLTYDIEKGRLKIGNERINLYLQSITKNYAYFNMIMILDNAGKIKNLYPYNQDYINFDMSGQEFYKEAKIKGDAYWSPVSISIKTGQPSTIVVLPFGQGWIAGYLDLSVLGHITEKIKISDSGYSMIVDQTGTIIAHKDFQFVLEQINIGNLDFIQKAFKRKEGVFEHQFMDSESLGSVSLVPNSGWIVVVTQPKKDAFAPVNKITALLLTGLILSTLFAIIISMLISKRFSQPLIRFQKRTKMVADGDYSSPFQTEEFNAYSEISELAHNFNRMADAVKNREESLSFAQFSIDNASEAIFWGNSEGKLLYVNKAACRMLGYQREALLQKYVYDIDLKLSKEELPRAFKNFRLYDSLRFETIYQTTYGKAFPVDVTSSILNYGGQEYFFAFVRDISERKLGEKALAEEKELLAVTLRSIGEGVISADIEGNIIFMNRMAESIIGQRQNEVVGLPIQDVFHITDNKSENYLENLIIKIVKINDMSKYSGKNILFTRAGEKKNILLSAMPVKDRESKIIGIVLTFRDITEQSRFEDELFKADKLQSLGLLAGGIAHDFNNLLTGILGNIGLSKIFIGVDHKAYMKLETAEKAIERAKDLTQQLLTFSKGGAPVRKASSIEQIVRDSSGFSLRGSNVRCEFSIADDILPVEVDEGQMSRVINNLILNASQSMPDGGIINIKIENVIITKADNMPIKEGSYVLVSVQDHGKGIPEESLNKIFDPYFTTKKKGSGLGLAVVYSIVKSHNGHIRVNSNLNEGTTFDIFIPASENKLVPVETTNEIYIRGKGKILVMDDEEIIRIIAKELLNHLGYEVELSKNGEEALRLYKNAREAGSPFDAVITDLTVPGAMGGRDLMTFLLKYDPNVKVIVSSGYSNDPIMGFYKDFGFSGVVLKPYKIKELSVVLNKLLNSNIE